MPTDSIKVDYTKQQDWGDVFQGQLSITNNSDTNLVNWDLDFDLPAEITDIWNAKITESSNGSYTIENASWNREIAAGETITVGFVGNGNNDVAKNFDIEGTTFGSLSTSDSIYTSSSSLSSNLSLGETYQGRATFYDAANPVGGKGASGYDNLSGSALAGITAINSVQWDGSEASGGFFEVTGPKQREGADPIVVQVVDLLPERADGLDLSEEAFEKIADPVAGIVNIEYELVGPGDNFRTPHGYTIGQGIVTEGVAGSNPWYAAVRLNNHRYPVESVEILKDGGGTTEMTRGVDNRFVLNSGSGISGSQDLLVTDIFGQEVTLDNVNITGGDGGDIATGEQFDMI